MSRIYETFPTWLIGIVIVGGFVAIEPHAYQVIQERLIDLK
jgi:hypothetical protein